MRAYRLLLLGVLVLPTLSTATATDAIPDDKAVITFDTKTGLVTFNHALHATVRGIECNSCHHTHKDGEPIKQCSECHKKDESAVPGFSVLAPKNKDAYHDKCKGCHKYTVEELAKPAGPTKCKLCHIKSK
jgi:hypothetical protein